MAVLNENRVQKLRNETTVELTGDDARIMAELLSQAKAKDPGLAAMKDQDLIMQLIERGIEKSRGGREMKKKVELMDDLMSSITQTDFWESEQLHNPEILAADKALAEALSKLQGLASKEVLSQITDAAYSYASAFGTAAILYGIFVADAIHDVAAHPSELSWYILERIARR